MKRPARVSRLTSIEPYWYAIALFLIGATVLLLYHLVSGGTPSRVAIHIAFFNFDIFWYGILIVSGIALGSYVTARLALERAQYAFDDIVPTSLKQRSIEELGLDNPVADRLQKLKIQTVGNLLFEWGLSQNRLALKKEDRQAVAAALESEPDIDPEWLADAPWRQWNPDYVWGGIAWCMILAIIGARLYHVLTPSPSMESVGIFSALDYFRSPMQLINLRSGGLGIYGGIIGGAVGLFLYTRRHRISAIAWADIAVVGLALGQAIGRWGNFFNQELYGLPSELPWAINIDPIYRLDEYVNFSTFHPAFLYESLWSFVTFIILLILARRYRTSLQTGDLMALYLVLYALGRVAIELVRLDSRTFSLAGIDLGLPVATIVSIVIALPMAALLIWRHLIDRSASE